MILTKKILIIISFLALLDYSYLPGKLQSDDQVILYIFNKIEQGLDRGDVSEFRYYLNTKIFLSLTEDISSYYTINHSYYILTDFFELYKPTSFSFEYVSAETENPFAYGSFNYYQSGEYGKFKVYVSLEKINHQWKITQITFS
jgi:hypothetical protein